MVAGMYRLFGKDAAIGVNVQSRRLPRLPACARCGGDDESGRNQTAVWLQSDYAKV